MVGSEERRGACMGPVREFFWCDFLVMNMFPPEKNKELINSRGPSLAEINDKWSFKSNCDRLNVYAGRTGWFYQAQSGKGRFYQAQNFVKK